MIAALVAGMCAADDAGLYALNDGDGMLAQQRLELPGSGFGPPLGMNIADALLMRKSTPRSSFLMRFYGGGDGGEKQVLEMKKDVNDTASQASGSYTGLIVDARGLGLHSCMSPRILFPDGSEVWGTIFEKPEVVIDYGIVSYYRQFGDAVKNERVGANPLVVDAVDVEGVMECNVVVSESDGLKILSESWRSGFLDAFAVGFLKD